MAEKKKKSDFEGPEHLKPKFGGDEVKKFEEAFKKSGWQRKIGTPTNPKKKK